MQENPNVSKKLYVALDCLLDTRLGALVTISPDFAFEVTSQPSYYQREQDLFSSPAFGTLSVEKLGEVQTQLQQTVLKNSMMTRMYRFVRELASQFVLRGIGTPYTMAVQIEVNTYPYVLNAEETQAALQALAYRMGEQFEVSLVHKSPAEMGLSSVRQNYAAMVMYRYHDWLNLHDLEIKKKPLKEVILYVPRLYFGEPPNAEALASFAEHNTAPFELSQQVLAPLVQLQYLPIALYCVDTPSNPG